MSQGAHRRREHLPDLLERDAAAGPARAHHAGHPVFPGNPERIPLPLIVVRASPELWTLPFGLSTLGRGGAGGQTFDYPVMLGGSMLTIIPLAIVFIVLQRFFARGVVAGAVKG
jgi:ABC-type maltose transport system permease subunit